MHWLVGDLSILFFFYMVQAYLIIATGVQLFNLKVNPKKLLLSVVISGLAIWLVRLLYVSFKLSLGTHTLVLLIALTLIIKMILKINFNYSLGITLSTFCLTMLGSGIAGYISNINHISLEYVINNVWLHILFGQIENMLLIIVLVISKKFDFHVFKPFEGKDYEI
ncbi:hypothetical protein RDV78_07160 [Bacillota bacterium LX-D]|nr:hypothetical protein [Bacillota bacterium LX-D]